MIGRAIIATIALAAATATYAAYPERPVRLIVPSTPGSGPDAVARIFAMRLGTILGEQIVADNRAGSNGVIASGIVSRAEPDGYTLLITSGGHTINPHIYRKLPYDTLRDFTAITRFAKSGGLLVVAAPGFPAHTVKQLIDLARAHPNGLSYASAGVGNLTHLAGEMFNTMAGVKMTHIPYKGGGPALIDVMGGQVQVMFASVAASIPHVKAGRLQAIAYTGQKRFEQLPNVPTVSESGLKSYEASGWYGLYGPAGLPPSLVNRLYTAARDAVHFPETRSAYAKLNVEPSDTPPAAFAQFLKEDLLKYGKLVRAAGIEPQ